MKTEFWLRIGSQEYVVKMTDNITKQGRSQGNELHQQHTAKKQQASASSSSLPPRARKLTFELSNDGIPESRVKRAKLAYGAIFLGMLLLWTAGLLGMVFTFRENLHGCENCPNQDMCRDTTPAWGGTALEECARKGMF